uniref:RNA 3'-terminal phosphate cyclase n=1 Tax=Thaumasiovibrio occultus TaxID=1891184 RepID=UPI000B35D6D5|nr:RNA 3'-terminal phosphate cyclase [Thaumasiovibrio occultus]
MRYIQIDGSMGEGGGQVLRTSLTLSMLYQMPIEISNIRAGRNKPGLLRQHLTCVLAAAEISSAQVEGAELGATRLRFAPGSVKAGEYHFAVGSAGSTALVCQTVLLPLALTGQGSRVIFEGGTHNMAAPSLTFLTQSFLPLLAQQGLNTKVTLDRVGFYPAGGGRWQLDIDGVASLAPLRVAPEKETENSTLTAVAMISKLANKIGEREITQLEKSLRRSPLGDVNVSGRVESVESIGPGNMLLLTAKSYHHAHVFEMAGSYGVKAEAVAKRVAGRYCEFYEAEAEVEHYLADQLLLPLLVGGAGAFITSVPSGHLQTNVALIRQLTGKPLTLTPHGESRFGAPRWQVALSR